MQLPLPADATADDQEDRAAEFTQRVLDVVEAIPPGRVMAYGDIAEYLGDGGPRRVARVMSSRGDEVPWWRVLRADGTPAPPVAARQIRHLRDEGTPMRPSGDRVDIAHARWLGPEAALKAGPPDDPPDATAAPRHR